MLHDSEEFGPGADRSGFSALLCPLLVPCPASIAQPFPEGDGYAPASLGCRGSHTPHPAHTSFREEFAFLRLETGRKYLGGGWQCFSDTRSKVSCP